MTDWLLVVDGLGMVHVATAWLVAAFAFWAAPRARANQFLAAYMLVGGIVDAAFVEDLVPDRVASYSFAIYTTMLAWGLLAPLYLSFLGAAIPSPLARPFRKPAVTVALLLVGASVATAIFLAPAALVSAGELRASPHGGHVWALGPAQQLWAPVAILIWGFSTVCSVDALRRAPPGTIARVRAKAYVQAFLLIDAAVVLAEITWAALGVPDLFDPRGQAIHVAFYLLISAGTLMVARGMLRYQLFDFDLKLKRSLKRGTLVAIILGAFFVVSALAEQYLQQFGWIVGGLAVGALLFALRPIERAIDRLADRAMPKTTGTPEYLAQRKHEIYRAAIEDAMRDGVVSAKERALLLRLADNLGLSAEESGRIERDVLGVPPA
jgi:hypothetical protein